MWQLDIYLKVTEIIEEKAAGNPNAENPNSLGYYEPDFESPNRAPEIPDFGLYQSYFTEI